jgi:hypothetical protein
MVCADVPLSVYSATPCGGGEAVGDPTKFATQTVWSSASYATPEGP